MGGVVVFDTNLTMWGIKRFATKGQEQRLVDAERLIKALGKHDYQILIPTPTIAEVCTLHETQQERLDLFRDLVHSNKYMTADFDDAAALACAQIRADGLTSDQKKYAKEHGITKTRIKFDQMIAAIAAVNHVTCLYTEDNWLYQFADKYVPTRKVHESPPNLTNPFGEGLFEGMQD